MRVTLTFAQSIDGVIGRRDGKQLILSGPESYEMTHSIRASHDAVLIGIGTLLNDTPGLNVRLPNLLPIEKQPTPIIIDSNLQTPIDAKIFKNLDAHIGKSPIIIHSANDGDKKISELSNRGARLLKVPSARDFKQIVSYLEKFDPTIKSIMIEGGATIISSMLKPEHINMVDSIIITVAPKFIGKNGARPNDGDGDEGNPFGEVSSLFREVQTRMVGKDYVAEFERLS